MLQHDPKYIILRHSLRNYENLRQTRSLLDRMAERANEDALYCAFMHDWLENGGTIALRDLLSPFGDFMGDLENFNLFCALDSAHPHCFAPVGQERTVEHISPPS